MSRLVAVLLVLALQGWLARRAVADLADEQQCEVTHEKSSDTNAFFHCAVAAGAWEKAYDAARTLGGTAYQDGHRAEALVWFCLAHEYAWDAETRREVSETLDTLRQEHAAGVAERRALVIVRHAGGRGELSIDGRSVGPLPWCGLLRPGRHHLWARLADGTVVEDEGWEVKGPETVADIAILLEALRAVEARWQALEEQERPPQARACELARAWRDLQLTVLQFPGRTKPRSTSSSSWYGIRLVTLLPAARREEARQRSFTWRKRARQQRRAAYRRARGRHQDDALSREEKAAAWEAYLDALCPADAPESAEAVRKLVAVLRARRWSVPHVLLGWGALPAAVPAVNPLLPLSFKSFRRVRPDRLAASQTRLDLMAVAGSNVLLPRGGPVTAAEDAISPVPWSPRVRWAGGTNRPDPAHAVLSCGLLHGAFLGSEGLRKAGSLRDDIALLPDCGLEFLLADDPADRRPLGGLLGGEIGLTPLDHLNPTFPFPGTVLRGNLHVAGRVGHSDGLFDIVLGGSGSFRTVHGGDLPNSLFPPDAAPTIGSHEPDPRSPTQAADVAYRALAAQVALVGRPLQRLELRGNWSAVWAWAPPAPTRSYAASGLHRFVAGVGLQAPLAGSDSRAVADLEAGVLHAAAATADQDPGYLLLTGRAAAAIEWPAWAAHVALEHHVDPASFHGDLTAQWRMGMGLRGESSLESRLLGIVDGVAWFAEWGGSPFERFAPSVRQASSIDRVGYRWVGDGVQGNQSHVSHSWLRAGAEVSLAAGFHAGCELSQWASRGELSLTGPFGNVYTMDSEPTGSTLLLYYVGWDPTDG